MQGKEMSGENQSSKSELVVIGAGMGRTGTKTLMVALNQLGINCYHMVEVRHNPNHMGLWVKIMEAEARGEDFSPLWDELFGKKYRAAVDFPTTFYYKELMALYPNAKVILTRREAGKWYESVQATIYGAFKRPGVELGFFWLGLFHPMGWKFHTLMHQRVWGPHGVMRGLMEDREKAIARFDEWNKDVIATVPKERLLVIDIDAGYNWDVLCPFVNVPPPTTPFPRVNEKQEMEARFRVFEVIGYTVTASVIAATIGLAFAVAKHIKSL